MSATTVRCLAIACLMALAIFAPIAASRLRRSRQCRLTWRRKFPRRLSQREQREWMRLCWVLEHVDPYDPDAVAADETEGEP